MNRKPHRTLTPTFIVGLLALIFSAIAAWPVIRGWFPKPPVVSSASVVQSPSVPAEPLQGPEASAAAAATPKPQATPLDDKPEDASDLFLAAYLACVKGKNLTASNSIAAAIQSYKKSDEILSTISKKFPTWNKPVVEYRRNRVAEALQILESGNLPQAFEDIP